MSLFLMLSVILNPAAAISKFKQEKPAIEALCSQLYKAHAKNGKFDTKAISLNDANTKKLKKPDHLLTCLMVGQFEKDFNGVHRLEFESVMKKSIDMPAFAALLDELSEEVYKDTPEQQAKALSSGDAFFLYYTKKVQALKNRLSKNPS
jgi:hypothetical protein